MSRSLTERSEIVIEIEIEIETEIVIEIEMKEIIFATNKNSKLMGLAPSGRQQ